MSFSVEHLPPTRRLVSVALAFGLFTATVIQAEAIHEYHSSLTVAQYCVLSLSLALGFVVIALLNPLQRPGIMRQIQYQSLFWSMIFFSRDLMKSFYAPAQFPLVPHIYFVVATTLFLGISMFLVGVFFSMFERRPDG